MSRIDWWNDDTKTSNWALKVLPVLVRQARSQRPITYKAVAADLIPQERAALTRFDMEVLNRRPDPRTDGKRHRSSRTSRDAGQAIKPVAGTATEALAKTQPARRRAVAGGYK